MGAVFVMTWGMALSGVVCVIALAYTTRRKQLWTPRVELLANKLYALGLMIALSGAWFLANVGTP